MIVKNDRFIFFITNILYIFFALILLWSDYNNWISHVFILFIVAFITNVVFLKKTNESIISLGMVFYVLISLFHISQIYFGYIGYRSRYCIFTNFNLQSCIYALSYAFICIHIMIAFYYIKHKKVKIDTYICYKQTELDKQLIRLLFYIFLIPKIIIRCYLFYIGTTKSYIALLVSMNALTSTIVMVSDIFSIAYVNVVCTKKERKFWIPCIVVMELLFMLSGSRIQGAIFILMLFITLNANEQQNSNKSPAKPFVYILIAGGVLFFMATISGSRFSNGWSNSFIGNGGFLNSIIEEFGYTILNTTVAIDNSSEITRLNGMSYYGGLVYIFPNIGDVFSFIEQRIFYQKELNAFYQFPYGGSIIAESYMNFGYIGFIIFPFVGMALTKFEKIIANLKSYRVDKMLFYLMLSYQFVLWIRSYFYQLIRLPIWLFLLYFFLRKMCKTKNA